MSVEKGKKRDKFVIPFLYIETMGVNGVDTPDPHLLSAETDRLPAVTKRLNAMQNHVRNGMIISRLKCCPTGVSSLCVLTVDL